MIVILDTAKGQALNFKTRKEAAQFIGVSLPTLRSMLAEPFYLFKTLILTNTTHEKIKRGNRELVYKDMRQREVDKINVANKIHVQGVFDHMGDVPINGSRPEETTDVGRD